MKRLTKKMLALLLSAVMVLAMGISVCATGETEAEGAAKKVSVTIKDPKETPSTYYAYQVMTATEGTDGNGTTVYTYEVTDAFENFFGADKDYNLNVYGEIVKIVKNDTETEVIKVESDGLAANTNSTEAAALAAALEKYALENGIEGTEINVSNPTDLSIGYYVISETATPDNSGTIATKPILVDLTKDVTIEPKDDEIGLDKTIVEEGKELDANNVNIGDSVDYKITTQIPTYAANVDKTKLSFVLTDTLTNLEYNEDTAVLTIGGNPMVAGTDYTIEVVDNVITVTLAQDTIIDHQGETVVLTYSATLTKGAVVDSKDGNPNKVTLEYTTNPNVEDSEGYLEDEVKTYTYGFKIHKVDKNDEYADMTGATFEIRDSDGKLLGTFTYGDNGEITSTNLVITTNGNYAEIKGLDEGTYTITETKAPEGYSLLGSDVIVTIKDTGSDDGTLTGIAEITVSGQGTIESELKDDGNGTIDLVVKIENIKGISLPETGSRTAMYCLLGGAALILLGGLYFGLNRLSEKKRQ